MQPRAFVTRLITAMLAALAHGGASAAIVSLTPSVATTGPGGLLSFDVVANFNADVTVGGAFDLSWDANVLSFEGFSFGPALAVPTRDTIFDIVDPQLPGLVSIGFGNFSGVAIPTSTVIGTLAFSALGSIGTGTALTLADSAKWSGFFAVTGLAINTSYMGATAQVVPLPAAAWLLLSGIGGLAVSCRRRLLPIGA